MKKALTLFLFVLFVLSELQLSGGQIADAQTIRSSGIIDRPNSIIFGKIDFETGDTSQIDHFYENPSSIVLVQSQIKHTGSYGLKCEITDTSNDRNRRIEMWEGWDDATEKCLYSSKEAWVEGWLYLPTNFRLKPANNQIGWESLMSIREIEKRYEPSLPYGGTKTFQLKINLHQVSPDDESHFIIVGKWESANTDLGTGIFGRDKEPIPLGTWVHLQIHVIRDKTNGLFEVYRDGKQVIGATSVRTWGFQDSYRAEWKHYTNIGQPYLNTLYWDDLKVKGSP